MKILYVFTMVICFALFLGGCSSNSGPEKTLAWGPTKTPAGINEEQFCQHWIHSPEEQSKTDLVQIYRPKDFKEFPPSRFRMQYIFDKNGDCEWYFLAPDDGHRFKSGKWRIDPNDNNILQIVKGDTTESFRIVELTKDILRIDEIKPDGESN